MQVTNSLIFNGYQDVVVNFWGLVEDAIENEEVKKSKFWTERVVFVCNEDNEEHLINKKLFQIGIENEKETIFNTGVNKYNAFTITSEGGFYACLIFEEDFDKIVKETSELIAIER